MQLSSVSAEKQNSEIRQQAEKLMKDQEWMQALIKWEVWFEDSLEHEREPNSFHDLGICKFNLGNASSAIKNLDTAANLQPDYGYRFAARGWMKQSIGDIKGAIADYKKALELDPEDVYTQNNLIILEEKRSKK